MRLIDADKLIKELDALAINIATQGKTETYIREDAVEIIDSMPTIDAVEVVRCKDCKYNDADEKIRERFCPDPTGRFMLLNGFCSCGDK